MAWVWWEMGGAVPPMPYRSVVDGSVVETPTKLPMPGLWPDALWIMLDDASRKRFVRYRRLEQYADVGVAACACVCWVLAHWWHEFGYLTFAVWIGGGFARRRLLARVRPPQYPMASGGRMVLQDVHPDTARAWQELAGPAIRTTLG
ncbi:hypothetical protein Dvina_31510 [Dactylosporangium vinaceum]|uniref:Transposase n=1 Tax=Dactylosporangium vinaceum TaxID=53362 RepID=A0ABV5MJM7_9ACTN|nr:hypothetical protein [Dactylosporangium vinaceum]UAB92829.1 hypothetical protein Dvina_31510 [Dactylosporangium vinaceum]